jgi:hypothetical protein
MVPWIAGPRREGILPWRKCQSRYCYAIPPANLVQDARHPRLSRVSPGTMATNLEVCEKRSCSGAASSRRQKVSRRHGTKQKCDPVHVMNRGGIRGWGFKPFGASRLLSNSNNRIIVQNSNHQPVVVITNHSQCIPSPSSPPSPPSSSPP